ncbi:uncharacterized protein LOC111089257, partial [Limulus polyphemus]|uniref:Uncharacterized protein LOC111089257 n=1 Tax=Limulus polyphemus TaxID=6850 RepID=A0ABM1TML9_LIMPO
MSTTQKNRGRLADKKNLGKTTQNGQVSPSAGLENSTDEQAHKQKNENDGLPADDYTNSFKGLTILAQNIKSSHQRALTTMDTVRKQVRGGSTSPEPKRESRLTTIIDQLLSNKTKDKHLTEVYNKRSCKGRENLYENQPHSPASQDN